MTRKDILLVTVKGQNNFLISIVRKSSALIPASPIISEAVGLYICLNFSIPAVVFSALLFTSIATTEFLFRYNIFSYIQNKII